MTQSFEYSALSGSTSFRLIRLEAGRENDIAFAMSEHELNDAPAYSALSYRWGSDLKTHKVKLNGKDIAIHANLWHFLRQLRVENDDSSYWTDALCINQEDVPERNQQVAVMADIYSQAQGVVVWLGSHFHVQNCLESIKQLSQPEASIEDDGDLARLALHNAYTEIFNLPYWQRTWIVPEVTLGKAVTLKSLAVELPIEYLFSRDSQHAKLHEEYPRVKRAQALLRQINLVNVEGKEFRLESWLYELKDLQCKDPRDKLYSLLGLHKQKRGVPSLPGSLIDYNKSIMTVHWDFAFTFLLEILSCAATASTKRIVAVKDWLRDSLMDEPHPEALALTVEKGYILDVDGKRLYDALCRYIVQPLVSRKYSELAEHLRCVVIAYSLASPQDWAIRPDHELELGLFRPARQLDLSPSLQCFEQGISVLALGVLWGSFRHFHKLEGPDIERGPRCGTCNMHLECSIIDEDELRKLNGKNLYSGRSSEPCGCAARRKSTVQLLRKVGGRGGARFPLHVKSSGYLKPSSRTIYTSLQVGQGCVSFEWLRGRRKTIVIWTRHPGNSWVVSESESGGARSRCSEEEAGNTKRVDYTWFQAVLTPFEPLGLLRWVVWYVPQEVNDGPTVPPW